MDLRCRHHHQTRSNMPLLDGGLYGNIAAAVVTLIYVKTVVAVCDFGVSSGHLAPDVSRKLVHLAAACLMCWWPLFDAFDHPSWCLNITVSAIFSVQLFVKGAILKDPNDPDVRTMSRTGDPAELLRGPLFFTLAMNINGLFLFYKPEAVYCMAALGFGDGVAPLVGKRFPLYKYSCPGGTKTVGGSLAVFFFCIAGFFLFRAILGIPFTLIPSHVLAMATTATVAEALSPVDLDNIVVPVAVYVVMKYYCGV